MRTHLHSIIPQTVTGPFHTSPHNIHTLHPLLPSPSFSPRHGFPLPFFSPSISLFCLFSPPATLLFTVLSYGSLLPSPLWLLLAFQLSSNTLHCAIPLFFSHLISHFLLFLLLVSVLFFLNKKNYIF